jgi:hypothetical protein
MFQEQGYYFSYNKDKKISQILGMMIFQNKRIELT